MKAGKQLWKNAAGLFFLALIWSGVCLWQAPASKAQAAEYDSRGIKIIGSQDKYDWNYTKAFVGEKDAGVKIDGVLSEELWENKKWLTHMDNYDGMYKQSDKGATFVDGQCKMALIYDEHTDRFYFYVNDVLFDSVKRSDYMNGTKFRYGIVGYMTGADGSPRPVTASDPFAVFTKPELTREFSVSVPSGATLTMDGERISF